MTNHEPRQKKFITASQKEDEQFFRYKQALAQYNSEKLPSRSVKRSGKYERGSILQKVLDPFAGAQKLENGALFYEVEEKELNPALRDDEKLR